MTHVVTVGHHDILVPRTCAKAKGVEGRELFPGHDGLALVSSVFLVFALHRSVATSKLAKDVNAHIWAFQPKTTQDIIRDIGKSPDLVVLADVFEVENTEVLKDIPTDLLVITRAHFSEGVRRLIIPRLAFGDESVKEIERGPQKDAV